MRSSSWKESSRRFGRAAALALAFAAGCGTVAFGASFYKWTDAEGNVHYSDTPPKLHAGPVTRVEVDPDAHSVAPPKLPPAAAEERGSKLPAPGDYLEQRRATRDRLEADLAAARERLDVAQKALAEYTQDGEGSQLYNQRQVDPASINANQPTFGQDMQQQSIANPDPTQSTPTQGGMLGMAPRSNCRQAKNKDGKTVLVCPTIVPNPEYYERVQHLEDEVKLAEKAVEDAERAYRQGVD